MSADKSPLGFQPSSRITGSLVTPAKPVFTAKSAVTICICLKSFFLPSRHIDHEAAKINEATQIFLQNSAAGKLLQPLVGFSSTYCC